MRYVYGLTTALLVGGAAVSLATGYPAGAQVAQNDETQMARVVPRAGAPESFADLTAQLQPAVVNIATRQRVEVEGNPFAGTPLEGMFRGRQGDQPQTREAQSLGSGFIISSDGYVVTNNHVVSPPTNRNGRRGPTITLEEITVTMPDGTEYEAELVGADEPSDLAVLKIKSNKTFPFVKFGDSEEAREGDWVIAIGNPFGLGGTVTSGIVSAVLRTPPNGRGGAYERYIQTDASINRGNSGGPLFDMQGNVIGVNNAIISPTGGSVGIGFAIPAEIAAPIVEKLKAGQEIERGFLGVNIEPVNSDMADALGLPRNRGEIIQYAQPGMAADLAGIEAGDIVTKINGVEVTLENTLSFIVANIEPGTRVPIELIREGRRMTVNATIGKRPDEDALREMQQTFDPDAEAEEMPEDNGGAIEEKLGIAVQELTAEIARQLGVPADTDGVVVSAVDRNADAARKGLDRGDIILEVQYSSVASVAELEEAILAAEEADRESVLLTVKSRRIANPRYVAVRLR
ncbi:Do family serine endopeptidase [Altererythrobacter lutimaris]|uniref:Probable periplasmic serine endoprotease DegP-like n=1 Tax=Altererythrobacter lutimaris TaxID=2743979 RepID=A0A850HF46_9SPHN|nr:Do family serine endopeptidase [Altererythrobacter lutimaris]NVE95588.1 Do family serine endopeptidase [Altererythrobacter lutimaris]